MAKGTGLHARWGAPDNSRVTSKQYSFRLPLHVAAKIAALEEIYRNRTKTEIVGDLLAAALEEVERTFPSVKGRSWGEHPETGEELFEDAGPLNQYRAVANKHYIELEHELGNEAPRPLFEGNVVVSEADLKGQ